MQAAGGRRRFWDAPSSPTDWGLHVGAPSHRTFVPGTMTHRQGIIRSRLGALNPWRRRSAPSAVGRPSPLAPGRFSLPHAALLGWVAPGRGLEPRGVPGRMPRAGGRRPSGRPRLRGGAGEHCVPGTARDGHDAPRHRARHPGLPGGPPSAVRDGSPVGDPAPCAQAGVEAVRASQDSAARCPPRPVASSWSMPGLVFRSTIVRHSTNG
jgi:hypothetical protein